MDAAISKIFIAIALFFCLTSCANLPSQDFKFSLGADSLKSSQWFQSGLASSGSVVLNFRLREFALDAADVRISMGDFDKQNPMLKVSFNDKRCVGSYEVAISYRVSAKEWRSIYPKTRFLWGEDSKLSIYWDRNGKATISINNVESKTIDMVSHMKTIRVEVLRGGIDVYELAYRDIAPAIN